MVNKEQGDLKENEIKSSGFAIERQGTYFKQLKKQPVYGPINSRRLGLSLGINPIQGGFACNWGCVYCQYGIDDLRINQRDKKIRFTEIDEIKTGLEKRLGSNEHFDSITICGPTEPTLHPYINDIIDLAIEERRIYSPDTPVTLFTNSSRLGGVNLDQLDWVFMKLDAGNEETFQKFNRPRGMHLNYIIEQIQRANPKKRVIQTMIAGGDDGNLNEQNIGDYLGVLKDIRPDEVHLYSLLYSSLPQFDVLPVSRKDLELIAKRIKQATNSKPLVFSNPVQEGDLFRY